MNLLGVLGEQPGPFHADEEGAVHTVLLAQRKDIHARASRPG